MNGLTPQESWTVLRYATPETRAEIFTYLEHAMQVEIISTQDRDQVAALLAELASDDRVDVLEHVPPALHESVMRDLAPAEADEVRRLEQYSPETAGGIMTTDVMTVPQGLTVDEAIADLRARRRGADDQVYYVYTVDDDGRLAGVVSMRDLILSGPGTTLASVARDAVAVAADTDQEEVARLLRKHGIGD